MTLDYLQIFRDKRELLEPFTREEKGELLEAMLSYAFDGVEIALETNARYIWPVFRKMIDQSKKAFEAKSNAGKRKPKQAESDGNQSESNDIKTNQTPSDMHQTQSDAIKSQQAESDGNQNESKAPINQESRIKNQESRIKSKGVKGGEAPPIPPKARARFIPPTPEDVAAYCRERGNGVNPQRFVDFYAAKGWRVGGQPMKDWQAAVRTWEGREDYGYSGHPPDRGKTVSAQRYAQRSYTEAELTAVSDDLLAEARAARGGSP